MIKKSLSGYFLSGYEWSAQAKSSILSSMQRKIRRRAQTAILLFLLSGHVFLHGNQKLEDLRGLTLKWVALEQSISKEALAWEEKQSQLNDFIKIAQVEVEGLQEELVALEKIANASDTRRQELLEKQEHLNQYAGTIRTFLTRIETKLRTLKPRLPQPLQDNLIAAYQKMPQEGQSTSLGIAERMQTVIGILTMIQRFDDVITVTQEIKTLPDQSKGEVTTFYVGLAAGYYVTTAGNDAGYGHPTDNGWTWKSDPSLMESITEAISIADGTSQEATFIELPVNFKD